MTTTNSGIPLDELRKLLPYSRQRLRAMMRETRKAILKPVPIVPADEWIEANCELSSELSDQGGFIRLYGYQRELVTAPFEPGVRQVVVPKSARVGFSLLAACLLAYVAAHRKYDTFLSQPVRADAQEFHDDFLAPLLSASRSLASLKRIPTKGGIMDRWNKMRLITGAAIRLIGAKKDDSFRRFKAFLGIMDELDADGYAPAAKGGQGDKATQAERRLDSYPNSVLIMGGTPTELKTSRLWKIWDQAEQRRYFWPCLDCCADGHPDRGMQYLEWGSKDAQHGFKWETNELGEVVDVYYQCRHNPKHRMREDDKAVMDDQGEWRVTRAGRRKGVRGYHIWEAYGFNPKSTWPVIVDRFLQAKRSGDLQPFVNLSLGEPHEDRHSVILEPHVLASHCRPYEAELPDEAIDWTFGVDVQKGSNKENSDGSLEAPQRYEATAWGWGVGNKPIMLFHRVVPFEGEPFVGESAAKLDELLCGFTLRRRDGSEVPYATAFIDGGHAQDAAIAYVKSRVELGWNDIHVVRGSKSNDPNAPIIMSRKGKSSRTGDEFTWLNLRPAKDHLDRLLRVQTPGPRYVEFPESIRENQSYFAGLLNEELRPERKGGPLRWLKKGGATGEPWDCFVYAYAAQIRAQQEYPAIDRLIAGVTDSPFKSARGSDEDVAEYPGPDRSFMSDKSEERGLVPARKSKPPQTTDRAQPRGQTTAAVIHQQSVPEYGSLQRKGSRRSKRSSMF
ncbi:terminase gpA endonuclease subunit [Pelagibacterium sp.]|uniref:terminase gpA endonuclease subunit n=1 Tax=Pelagibacterium sp. TaxID=1967288 RepID=UPI003A92B503